MSLGRNPIDAFLLRARQCVLRITDFDCVTVVLGNQTCDLDSVVSSVIYGYFHFCEFKVSKRNELAMTVLDIPKDLFQTKTESLYWLKKHKVTPSLLLFRDEIDLQHLSEIVMMKVILVDRHTLPENLLYLRPLVVRIIDHRPRERTWKWEGIEVIVELVGSCATLITRDLLNRNKDLFTLQFTGLLYGPIVLDTGGLNPNFGRTTKIDLEMVEFMEELYPSLNREETLQNLNEARADVSSLTPDLILIKDMKYANGIPLCGFPMLVQEFIKKENIEQVLERFCESEKVPVFILMGLLMESHDSIKRDIGVFSKSNLEMAEKLADYLTSSDDPHLGLKTKSNSGISGLLLFQQDNIKLSRKQILPLVQAAVDSIPELGQVNKLFCPCDDPEQASCSSKAC